MGKYQVVTFRCPEALHAALDKLALSLGHNRNAVVLAACKLFSRQVKERGGYIYPGGDDFPQPEKVKRKPRKKATPDA